MKNYFIVILQTGFLDIYSGPEPELNFWELIPPLRWLLWEGFLIWGVEGQIYIYPN